MYFLQNLSKYPEKTYNKIIKPCCFLITPHYIRLHKIKRMSYKLAVLNPDPSSIKENKKKLKFGSTR